MFLYDKKLQYPVKIANTNPQLARIIITQYGGPDGELGASLRYLSQRFSMPYPELKANENFKSLQNDLKETEDKISYARGFYNDTVLTYNNLREQFPSNIIASMFKFEKYDFFAADEKVRENPQVKF